MSIQELTQHPENLNRETLYELRRIIAAYPYYQPARLLMLKNLYLLHDPTFDEELRRSSIYFSDRQILFNLVESAHYRLKRRSAQSFSSQPDRRTAVTQNGETESRTVSLINSFLSSVPEEDPSKTENDNEKKKEHRKPTAADATIDYVAYLLSTDFEELNNADEDTTREKNNTITKMNGGDLIEAFIKNDGGRFTLQEEPEIHPEISNTMEGSDEQEEELITETMAGIYIKQGRYQKALDIIDKLNDTNKQKNRFAEDQQRFLKKLSMIQNNNKK